MHVLGQKFFFIQEHFKAFFEAFRVPTELLVNFIYLRLVFNIGQNGFSTKLVN